jgi:DNA polymerase I-like protein with 3'-5' exonuclease and polymerase domains
LQWSLVELDEIAEKEQWKTKIIGQIHDSILFDTYPPELEHVIKTVHYISTQKIREVNEWIIVPLIIEVESAPVDAPWTMMKEIEWAA